MLDLSCLSFDLYAMIMFVFFSCHIQFSLLFYKIKIAFDSRLWILWILNLEMTLYFDCSKMKHCFKIHWMKFDCRFNCVTLRSELFFSAGMNSTELFHLLILCLEIIWFPNYYQSLGLKVFIWMNIFFCWEYLFTYGFTYWYSSWWLRLVLGWVWLSTLILES